MEVTQIKFFIFYIIIFLFYFLSAEECRVIYHSIFVFYNNNLFVLIYHNPEQLEIF